MKNHQIRITLVISSLSCGGAERVLVLLAKRFIEREYQVSLVTLADKNTDFYQLPSSVKRLSLDIMGQSGNIFEAIKSNFKRIVNLRKAIQSTQPDLVISFLRLTNVITILALLGVNYPVVVTEHNNARIFSYGKFWETLRRLTYPWSSIVVSVSKGVDKALEPLSKHKRAVIYNPIIIQENEAKSDQLPTTADPTKNWIVSMGRLKKQKGFDLLLPAFHKVSQQYPDWQLLILGQGELREQLENMRDNLGLSSQVIFTGSLRNPFKILRQAKIFVMASRNEGFPMAHGEALACGLPVIATDCPSGPREMIRHNIDGLLVPNQDISALATAMKYLMSYEHERQRLAAKTMEVTERFNIDKIMTKWEILIQKLLEKKIK